ARAPPREPRGNHAGGGAAKADRRRGPERGGRPETRVFRVLRRTPPPIVARLQAHPVVDLRGRARPAPLPRPARPRGYPCARLTAASSARLANTRQSCALYSTEPCRSACTSTPSAAFAAAAPLAPGASR